jgi:uncharacterized protein (DUF433 family)
LPYSADATQLDPGSIVKVERPVSSSGKPTYPHFFIVLTIPDRMKVGDLIPLVGISSRIDSKSSDPAKHIAMKWLARRGGDPETGLERRCYACVDFTHALEVHRGNEFPLEVAAEHQGKFIRADKLQAVVATTNAWIRRTSPRERGWCDMGDAFPGIESTPGVCGGEPCIRRTTIQVWLLEQSRRLGMSEAGLLANYPTLRAEDLVNAWTYVRANRQEIDAQIQDNEAA